MCLVMSRLCFYKEITLVGLLVDRFLLVALVAHQSLTRVSICQRCFRFLFMEPVNVSSFCFDNSRVLFTMHFSFYRVVFALLVG